MVFIQAEAKAGSVVHQRPGALSATFSGGASVLVGGRRGFFGGGHR